MGFTAMLSTYTETENDAGWSAMITANQILNTINHQIHHLYFKVVFVPVPLLSHQHVEEYTVGSAKELVRNQDYLHQYSASQQDFASASCRGTCVDGGLKELFFQCCSLGFFYILDNYNTV